MIPAFKAYSTGSWSVASTLYEQPITLNKAQEENSLRIYHLSVDQEQQFLHTSGDEAESGLRSVARGINDFLQAWDMAPFPEEKDSFSVQHAIHLHGNLLQILQKIEKRNEKVNGNWLIAVLNVILLILTLGIFSYRKSCLCDEVDLSYARFFFPEIMQREPVVGEGKEMSVRQFFALDRAKQERVLGTFADGERSVLSELLNQEDVRTIVPELQERFSLLQLLDPAMRDCVLNITARSEQISYRISMPTFLSLNESEQDMIAVTIDGAKNTRGMPWKAAREIPALQELDHSQIQRVRIYDVLSRWADQYLIKSAEDLSKEVSPKQEVEKEFFSAVCAAKGIVF